MDKIIILINSGKRCGKDTAANIMKERIEELGKSAYITSFAETLKEDVSSLLGVTIEELDNLKNNNEIITIGKRELNTRDFIIERSEFVKSLTSNFYYAKDCSNRVTMSKADVVIIPDLRFKEEYEMFNNNNSRVFFIKLNSNIKECGVATEIEEFIHDYEFDNEEGSLDTLKFYIEKFLIEVVL